MRWNAAPSVEIGREGELLAANVRLGVTAIAAAVPVGILVSQPAQAEGWVGVFGVVAMLVIGVVLRALAAREVPPRWLGIASATVDVTLISAVNAALVVAGQPHAATGGRVFFSLYLLALSFSSLRFDVRLCIIAGAMAIMQYGTIVVWVARTLRSEALVSPTYGAFRWDTQFARIVILLLATGVNVMIVRQSRKFLDASLHDLLTGLANRRHCDLRLAAAVASADRSGRGLLIALADIDHFKHVNDRFGHGAGDEVLRTVAREMRAFFRASDLVGRWGGEEFLILCSDADAGGAVERIREFQRHFGEHAIELRGATGAIRLTLSIGIAVFPNDGRRVSDLVGCADRRLYVAKESGRNLVIADEDAYPEQASEF